jgi:hypothetical protein
MDWPFAFYGGNPQPVAHDNWVTLLDVTSVTTDAQETTE